MNVTQEKLEVVNLQRKETMEGALSTITQNVLNRIPRLVPNEDISDDSSRFDTSETSLSDVDAETKIEDILNSSDTNSLLETLKLRTSSNSEHLVLSSEDLITVTETSLENTNILDEFPLFEHSVPNKDIISHEIRLPISEKLNDKENDSISKRTRLSTENDELSTISRKMQEFQNTKSRIPLPIIQSAPIRRSKRLIEYIAEERDTCSPKKITGVLRPAIRQEKPILNLIVDSSSGQLNEATKYATEINAGNCEGIPIPTTPNELVTIPVNNSRKASKKTALVRAYRIEAITKKDAAIQIGFYSHAQYKNYFNVLSPKKIQKKSTDTISQLKEKKLRWANDLEW